MSRTSDYKESTVTLALDLPRVVSTDGGRVGHVLIHPSDISNLRFDTWDEINEVACHTQDGTYIGRTRAQVRWATPDDPTCKKCLRALKFVIHNE